MKVGIVTLHNYNFGSALQSYATQLLLESKGVESEIIDINNNECYFLNRITILFQLVLVIFRSPRDIKKIIRVFLAQRGNNILLSDNSKNELNRFNETVLHTRNYTTAEIKRAAYSEVFDVFLCGSDQVWNGSRVSDYYKFFLRFAPRQKRIAWAASFGEGKIADYNTKLFKKYIDDFDCITVREPSGAELVKQLTGRRADVLSDPVMMISANDWRKMIIKRRSSSYIFLFFIDRPSEYAYSNIIELQKRTNLQLLTFGYKHEAFHNIKHYDGSPFDLLAMIDNADYVMTDSFHVMVFATIFHKRFYIFERMYSHGQSQTSRVVDFLETGNLRERYEPEAISLEYPDFSYTDIYINDKKTQGGCFLNSVLNIK